LPLADDPSAEVRREVLLALRNISGEQAEAALAKIARGYDGSDRYLLEAIEQSPKHPPKPPYKPKPRYSVSAAVVARKPRYSASASFPS